MKEIPLTKGYVTIVDDEDYESLNIHKWWAQDAHPRITYACRWAPNTKSRQAIRIHHIILRITPEQLKQENLVTDHEDRDGLNNQKYNLRVVTRRINAINSARSDNAVGIYWDTVRYQYKAYKLHPTKVFIGWFHTFEDAVATRNSYENN